jgi:hypothetical protein
MYLIRLFRASRCKAWLLVRSRAQRATRWLLNAELRVRFRLFSREIRDGRSGTGGGSGFYPILLDIVAYLLKARTVEPEKQPLLRNDLKRNGYTRLVPRQRLVNTFPRKRITQQLACNNGSGVFLRWSMPRGYKWDNVRV